MYMDGNAKNVNQNMSSAVQDQALPQPSVQPIQVPTQPVNPVGGVNKEVGPISPQVSDILQPTESHPEIDKELAEFGVEARKDSPNLIAEHKEIGIDHAGPHVPVPTSPSVKVTLPMSEEEVSNMLKSGNSDESGKWLASLIKRVIRVMGLGR